MCAIVRDVSEGLFCMERMRNTLDTRLIDVLRRQSVLRVQETIRVCRAGYLQTGGRRYRGKGSALNRNSVFAWIGSPRNRVEEK